MPRFVVGILLMYKPVLVLGVLRCTTIAVSSFREEEAFSADILPQKSRNRSRIKGIFFIMD